VLPNLQPLSASWSTVSRRPQNSLIVSKDVQICAAKQNAIALHRFVAKPCEVSSEEEKSCLILSSGRCLLQIVTNKVNVA
jgi:hypothetical protein